MYMNGRNRRRSVWGRDGGTSEEEVPLTPPRFQTVPQPTRLARCGECGAVVDASEDGRRLHTEWHAELGPQPVIDLTELEAAII
jgi:hypothetical protein